MAERPITFVVPGVEVGGATRGGQAAAAPVLTEFGQATISINVTAQRGAGESIVRAEAVPGTHFVVMEITGGPRLCLHPETARELLQAQHDPLIERGGTTLAAGEVTVPARLRWRLDDAAPVEGATRGSLLGDVGLTAFHLITGVVEDKVAGLAATEIVKLVDSQVVSGGGVYRLKAEKLDSLKDSSSPSPIAEGDTSLVLIHGTFSTTSGTFGKLWSEYPQLVAKLFERFSDRVYGLDHPTLGASPVANAITLAKAAPAGARLHLLTHSRGGLVAEVLARVCSKPNLTNLDLFREDAASANELKELAQIVLAKRISVERVVRVACPARGTLLASKRLDVYVSILKWALELAAIPVAPQLIGFLGAIARQRADPDKVPGLAAQIPDSPLVEWLHTANEPINGELRVVAGDLKGDSVGSWVKTLLSDAFFWTDNDLVVQTRSMYGGSLREKDSTFILDQNGSVSHFSYFSNKSTASAVVNALTETGDGSPAGFNVIGPDSWAGKSATGIRAALASRSAEEAAKLPALFLLPGILGSNLKVGNDRVWLGWRVVNGFERLAYVPGEADIGPDGPVGIYYDDLAADLFRDHDVKPFAFDWRRPIADEARRLAGEVAEALDARKTSKQPVRMIAHSMGGLVARAMQIYARPVWDQMMAAAGARILMLGTPNGGSWTPMQVLSGDDTFGNLLINVGAPFSGNKSRQLIANFPGFMQLQAGLLDGMDTVAAWTKLAQDDLAAMQARSLWHNLQLQLEQFRWGIPSQAALAAAVEFRRALDKQKNEDLAGFADKLLLVVGKAASTPAGYAPSDTDKRALVYLDEPDRGDGRVTLENAMLRGVATWVADADHGSLPRHREAFEAYRELLNSGTTKLLATIDPVALARGALATDARPLTRSRPSQLSYGQLPPGSEVDVLSATAAPPTPSIPPSASLHIDVVNGDLTYIPEPLLIGHYRSSRLTGAEAAMDLALNNAMSASLRHGLYPIATGTHRVFLNAARDRNNPWQPPRPQAVIVAGLGPEGELRGTELVNTVKLAAIAWSQRLTESDSIPTGFTLATTLLGSGGTGVTAGQAAQLIAQGIREANEQLADDDGEPPRWPRVDRLIIIELYLDRASEAWNALQVLEASTPGLYIIAPTIERRIGALRQPAEAGYRGVEYDFISALAARKENGNYEIRYVVDSKRARNEVRPQPTQLQLIGDLVKTAANSTSVDRKIGKLLSTLLVPADIESFLGGSTETVLELNDGTAGIPWEILDSKASSLQSPWSIRVKLLRKLQTEVPTIVVTNASADDRILVIGDPACERSIYPRLPGARREAENVARCLADAITKSPAGNQNKPIEIVISGPNVGDREPDAIDVLKAVFQESWRIIHIAGHGEPPDETKNEARGVVLSNGYFLGPDQIDLLRVKPELVFVNCCHLAAADSRELTEPYNRAQFAAGVARALIGSGVRCVIAAGWAVDDHAASEFATTFYRELLRGARFIEAVATARERAYRCGGNTWAAYQCYGDPDWQFRTATGDAQSPAPAPGQEFSGIASAPSLILALEQIATKSQYQRAASDAQAVRLRYLESNFGKYWKHRGDVAEAFGNAWSKSNFPEEAIRWYDCARRAQDGTASFVAVEQLANHRIRLAWSRIDVPAPSRKAIDDARAEILEAMKLLDMLQALAQTYERENVYGSGFKRLAMLEAAAARADEEGDAIREMLNHYGAAEEIARSQGTRPLFYPAMNRIAAQLALADTATSLDQAYLDEIRKSMWSVPPDFWSVVGQTELEMFSGVSRSDLANKVDALIKKFRDHHRRVDNSGMWSSVFDTATFVLGKYQKRSTAAEAGGAAVLLNAIRLLTGRTQPVAANASPNDDQPSGGTPVNEPTAGKSIRGATRGGTRKKKSGTKRGSKKTP